MPPSRSNAAPDLMTTPNWLAGDELYGWAQDQINESQTEDIFRSCGMVSATLKTSLSRNGTRSSRELAMFRS